MYGKVERRDVDTHRGKLFRVPPHERTDLSGAGAVGEHEEQTGGSGQIGGVPHGGESNAVMVDLEGLGKG